MNLPKPDYIPGIGERLRKACMGRANAAGGLDVIEFKRELAKWFSADETNTIMKSRRGDLQPYCTALLEHQVKIEKEQSQSPSYSGGVYNTLTSSYTPATIYDSSSGINYSDKSNPIAYSDKNKRWCRCVAHVSAKRNVNNPYAVCTHSVGRDGRVSCEDYYRNEYHLPADELDALATLKGKTPQQYASILGY